MLVSAVQSGELDLPAYCDILKERVTRDKVRNKKIQMLWMLWFCYCHCH